MDMQEKYRQQLDISYSIIWRTDGKHRTNEELRLSDGGAEGRACNREMLEQEMPTIGFRLSIRMRLQ